MSEIIAVYGGSFDPPHLAHTLACTYVLSAHAVDRVLVVPVAEHPFEKRLAPFAHRLRMCELAMRDLLRTEVLGVENELARPSLTVRTLEHLQACYPSARLRLVIGSDLVAEAPSWHKFERIQEIAPPLVVPRAGHSDSAAALPAISSTEVRERLRAGHSTTGLLSPTIAAYALEHGLYPAEPL